MNKQELDDFEVLYERCCGLDVHKKQITACLITPGPDGRSQKEVRTFGTMTKDLLSLHDWLTANQCTHVAMESTGVYWKPVYNILEGSFNLLLVNAQHIKAVPGRKKTDKLDAKWIARLLRVGLLKGSFIPAPEIRELKDLVRHRTTLIRDKARAVQRVQKILEDANIKLTSVATDVMGVSSRAILDHLLAGKTDPEFLAGLAKGRLRKKIPELQKALNGVLKPHHRLLLAQLLAQIDFLDECISSLNTEIEERLRPFAKQVQDLATTPGLKELIPQIVISEVGVDLSSFPSAKHFASWIGVCPGKNESAGKNKSGKTTKGNRWLKDALIEAAWAASHTKDTYLSALYHKLVPRLGKKKALVAVAHSIAVAIYHILTEGVPYYELGSDYFNNLNKKKLERRLVRRLEELGYKVTLEEVRSAA
ncbi:MAG: IS110 family transposase [Bacillota bacterium]